MKIVGIITEYNPFHNGHLYHIQKAKEITGADCVLAVMSGDFMQRGAPAMMPKHIRAEMALKAGASVVLELPVCFSTGSAEYFAAGAVSLLDKLNCVDTVCFGSECGDIKTLEKIAFTVAEEPEDYKSTLRKELQKGRPFPDARQIALKEYFGDDTFDTVLKSPNNILGIEYIKALKMQKSKIKPVTIRRTGSGYHDETLNETRSSASAIRRLFSDIKYPDFIKGECLSDEALFSEIMSGLEVQVPAFCMSFFKDACGKRYPVCSDDFSLILKYRLLTETQSSLIRYADLTETLANRILNQRDEFVSLGQFCNQIKTRDVTYTRISRCLFHILLNITAENMHAYKDAGFCQYARILGFRKDCTSLLSLLKKNSAIPLITKLTHTKVLNSIGLSMLEQDIFSSDLYESAITNKFKTSFINEYKKQIITI